MLKIAGQVKQKLLRDSTYLPAILYIQLAPSIMLGTKLLQKPPFIFVTGNHSWLENSSDFNVLAFKTGM